MDRETPDHLLKKLDGEVSRAKSGWAQQVKDFPAALAVLKTGLADPPGVLPAVLGRLKEIHHAKLTLQHVNPNKLDDETRKFMMVQVLAEMVNGILRKKLDLPAETVELLLACAALGDAGYFLSLSPSVRIAEQFAQARVLSVEARKHLEKLRAKIDRAYRTDARTKEFAALIERIDSLLSGKPAGKTPKPFDEGEPWAAAAKRDVEALKGPQREKWDALLLHAQTADGSKPTQKWIKEAASRLDAFGRPKFREFLAAWLPLTPQYRTAPPPKIRHQEEMQLFTDASTASLKGLAWAAALVGDAPVCAALGDLGESCWKKIRNVGPRSKLVGNAVLWSLSAIGTNDAISQLSRINSKLKHSSARRLADKAMGRVVESTGKTREDLEEIAVPTFDLSADGTNSRTLGGFTLTVALTPDLSTELRITDDSGKVRKSAPAELKSHHAADFKAAQKLEKDLRKILTVQRRRIESILRLPERKWTYSEWRQRYIDHPILSRFGKRLIWKFDGEPAMHDGKDLLRADGKTLPPPESAPVQLWHPCADTLASVRAWRAFLAQREITQPFKQAHREVYLLTDAERATSTYSNRFAAHILRQHQFSALCAERGWQYRLQGFWDGGGDAIPSLDMPALNLKAEFWVQGVGTDGEGTTGVALQVATDQVRFYSREPERQLKLENIHPQVLSEVLRDIDLFVGVCSVANDPTWFDGGPQGRHLQYWQEHSFGDLAAAAEIRKEVLQGLVPLLAIADRCSFSKKFLVVKGELRTYKIHLGSGNILMEPNDQYLCIVQDRGAKGSHGNYFLPFEGDTTLSVILSKAFLLVEDEKIKDPTITRQISGA